MRIKTWILSTCIVLNLVLLTACGDGGGATPSSAERVRAALAATLEADGPITNIGINNAVVDIMVGSYLVEYISRLMPDDSLISFSAFVDAFIQATGLPIPYSSNSNPPKMPDRPETELSARMQPVFVGLPLSKMLTRSHLGVYPAIDCGASNTSLDLSVCAGTGPLPQAEHFVTMMVVAANIPIADPTYSYQYAFVFDSDGNAANNYVPAPAYPNDFFQDTDRWYVANYSPGSGWTLDVSTANGSNIQPAPSNARIVIDRRAMMLVVPADEFTVACPPHRMTTFAHTGDFGMNPPFDWSADVEPAVSDPLSTTCTVTTVPDLP